MGQEDKNPMGQKGGEKGSQTNKQKHNFVLTMVWIFKIPQPKKIYMLK